MFLQFRSGVCLPETLCHLRPVFRVNLARRLSVSAIGSPLVVEVGEHVTVDVAWIRVRDGVDVESPRRRGRAPAEEPEAQVSEFDSPDCIDVVTGAFVSVSGRALEEIVPERARPLALDAIRRLGKLNDAYVNDSAGISDSLGMVPAAATPSAAEAYAARARLLAQQLTAAKKLGKVTYPDIKTFRDLVKKLTSIGVVFNEDDLRSRVLSVPVYYAFDNPSNPPEREPEHDEPGAAEEVLPGSFTRSGGFAKASG